MKDLARLVKVAKNEIVRDHIAKEYHIENALGCFATDASPCRFYVTDDSGYRAITLGDVRGNVSLDAGERNNHLNHRGYVVLFSSQSHHESEREIWDARFPSQKQIEKILSTVAKGEKVKGARYYPGDSGIEETMKFLAENVRRYEDMAEKKGGNTLS